MKKLVSTIFCFLLLSISTNADFAPYSKVLNIESESKNFTFKHHHDWTNATDSSRQKMSWFDQSEMFKESNDYAFVELFNKSGQRLFKKPSPALTLLVISPDEQYFVGLSKIQIDNPYNFVVWNKSGKLLKKLHLMPEEIKMNREELDTFKKKFPEQYRMFKNGDKISFVNNFYYLDYHFLWSTEIIGDEALQYLLPFQVNNHLSPNISASVTNHVYYYNEKNPDLQFEYSDKNVLKSISLNDPKGERIEIPIEK